MAAVYAAAASDSHQRVAVGGSHGKHGQVSAAACGAGCCQACQMQDTRGAHTACSNRWCRPVAGHWTRDLRNSLANSSRVPMRPAAAGCGACTHTSATLQPNRITRCAGMQDKVVAIAKVLRGKLAKAPAHKQPLHTQVCLRFWAGCCTSCAAPSLCSACSKSCTQCGCTLHKYSMCATRPHMLNCQLLHVAAADSCLHGEEGPYGQDAQHQTVPKRLVACGGCPWCLPCSTCPQP